MDVNTHTLGCLYVSRIDEISRSLFDAIIFFMILVKGKTKKMSTREICSRKCGFSRFRWNVEMS